METDRAAALKSLLAQNPEDLRIRYMLAMELAQHGGLEEAVREFRTILARDADYVAAYYHGGQALEQLGRVEEARELYRQGIEACGRTGDAHTRDELQEVFDQLG